MSPGGVPTDAPARGMKERRPRKGNEWRDTWGAAPDGPKGRAQGNRAGDLWHSHQTHGVNLGGGIISPVFELWTQVLGPGLMANYKEGTNLEGGLAWF